MGRKLLDIQILFRTPEIILAKREIIENKKSKFPSSWPNYGAYDILQSFGQNLTQTPHFPFHKILEIFWELSR